MLIYVTNQVLIQGPTTLSQSHGDLSLINHGDFSMFLNLILIYFKITTLSSFILEHTFRDQTVPGQASIRGHDEY